MKTYKNIGRNAATDLNSAGQVLAFAKRRVGIRQIVIASPCHDGMDCCSVEEFFKLQRHRQGDVFF